MRQKARRARRKTLDNSRNLFEAIRRNDDKAVEVALADCDFDFEYAHRPASIESSTADHADVATADEAADGSNAPRDAAPIDGARAAASGECLYKADENAAH